MTYFSEYKFASNPALGILLTGLVNELLGLLKRAGDGEQKPGIGTIARGSDNSRNIDKYDFLSRKAS